MRVIAKNDLVVESKQKLEKWVVGLYDEGGYNLCQVDMMSGRQGDKESEMSPAVLPHYHEGLQALEREEICASLSGAIEQAFKQHPEDLDHFHHVIEHEREFYFEI